MTNQITHELIKKLQSQPINQLAQRAVTNNGIYAASENNAISATNTTTFSLELDTASSITHQKHSGRCWLFAYLNTVRHPFIVKHKLEDFEFSESYLYFYDKLEKSNAFYEKVITSAAQPFGERYIDFLFEHPIYEGGWWNYAASLAQKYGLVPKSVMPESVSTSDSTQLNDVILTKLRKDALALRELAQKDPQNTQKIAKTKESMLADLYRILTIAIGTPPTHFDLIMRDKDKKLTRDSHITPLEFAQKYVGSSYKYIVLANYPEPFKQYGQVYTPTYDHPVLGGIPCHFLNLEFSELTKYAQKQLESGEPVWFGCDVYADFSRKKGWMSTDLFDLDSLFDQDLHLDKAAALTSHAQSVNHAMTLTGVDIVDGAPTQWKVENSWGDEVGKKGYYTMSADWFALHGYMVVIREDLLPADLIRASQQTPIPLDPWDPLLSAGAPL